MTKHKSKSNARIICTAVLWAITGMLGVPLLQAQSIAADNLYEASDSVWTVFSEVIYFSGNNGDRIEPAVQKEIRQENQFTIEKEAVAQTEPVVIVTPSDNSVSVSAQTTTEDTTQSSSALSSWYAVAGPGISFGRSTFCSFAANGTHPGWNINIAAGRRINRLLSAEVSLDYTRLSLGAYDCCTNLWLGADGNRYFAPVTGMGSYSYNDLRSISNLVSLGAHLNVNLIAIRQTDSRWAVLISPAIYAVYSDAKVKQGGIEAGSSSGLHFGLGADLGIQYMFTPQWGLRFTSGINYITGKPVDALPREEHKTNHVWNTALKVIFKL